MGIYFVHSLDIDDHALQFVGSHMFRKDVNSNLPVDIYLDYLKECNARIFFNKELILDLEQLLEYIKLHL